MRMVGVLASATLAAALVAVPATANAATSTYSYTVSGVETYASSTRAVFVGTLAGSSASGTWYARVDHTALNPDADITGGSFGTLLTSAAPSYSIVGEFHDGSVERTESGSNCTRQVYTVEGVLDPVQAGTSTGTGDFKVKLTHHRKRILGRCITYAATVNGTVSFTV